MSKEWYGDEDKCGECAYNHYDKKEKCWVCGNPESENYGLMTAYDDSCEEFTGGRK